MQTYQKDKTTRLLFALACLSLTACGSDKEPDEVSYTTLGTTCPTVGGVYTGGDTGSYSLTFTTDKTVIYKTGNCTSSGTYTCNSDTQMAMSINATNPSGSSFCQSLGTYQCTLSMANPYFVVGCTGTGPDNTLNPPKTFGYHLP